MKWRCQLICSALLLSGFFAAAQKKWDGEGNDNQWKNPANWSPDGVPGTADNVVLDHTWVQESYTVFLQDIVTDSVNSLVIISKTSSSIQLVIPPINTTSPALHLNTGGNSLVIGENSLLVNRSGATAGNSITLNGNLIIQNGGKYLHGTLRGNTLLVSKLTDTDLNRKGIFEFDVPGTSGYILSVSARQFGTLQLSSTTAGKKSYSGSGNGNVTIKGDLIINDSSSFNLSTNGNLLISGNLKILGKFQWQPSFMDSIGRELHFNGDLSQFISTGILKMGTNFRKMTVSAGKLNLKSNIRFDSPAQGIHVLSGSVMHLDTSYLSGPGWLQTDSMSSLIIGSTFAIADTTNGAIRMALLKIHPRTIYRFVGLQDQQTGTRFPEMAGTMILQKPMGSLQLTNNLVIADSLLLDNGNIISNYNAILEFKGSKLSGSPQSHVLGPLKRTGNFNGDLLFPLGTDSSYAPTIISVSNNTDDFSSYMVSYHAKDPSATDSLKSYPVKSVSKNEYWIMNKMVHHGSSLSKEIIRLPIGSNSLKGIIGQPQIIHMDSSQMKWTMLPYTVDNQYPSTISSTVQNWKNGWYTFGELESMALPNYRLLLKWKREHQKIRLEWQLSENPGIRVFNLEFSTDLGRENNWTILTVPKTTSHYILPAENNQDLFIRVKGITEDDTLTSNLIRISGSESTAAIFPNPAHNRLYVIGNAHDAVAIILNDGRRLNQNIISTPGQSYVDITSLPSGLHRIGIKKHFTVEWHPFYKW